MDGAPNGDPSALDPPAAGTSTVTYEADSFARAVSDRLESEFVRCGPGDAPARVEQAVIGDLATSFVSFGFPVASRSAAEGVVTVCRILRAPAGAKWGDTNLAAGQIRYRGPKRHHVGVNPAGTAMLGVFCDADLLRETADLLGCVVDVDNLVGSLNASPELDDAFDDVADVLVRRGGGPMGDVTRLQHNLLAATVRAARLDHHRVGRSRSFVTSERIVDGCLELARSTRKWHPSTVDLCRAAGMSERRVRSAFLDVTGMPPNRYFRAAALNQARTLLRQTRKESTTVTEVAGGLGIYHLSHFARNYSELFGESPSDTLWA